ncbi:MAG: hypothetical protein JWQ89_3764 [Devosia sp.]|nr:hypothetical protein [Devosia sp.]
MNAPMTRVTQLMDGILLGECPRWHDGRLWFADWVGQTLYTLDEAGNHEVEAKIASLPFSIDWRADGRMLLVHAADNDLKLRNPTAASRPSPISPASRTAAATRSSSTRPATSTSTTSTSNSPAASSSPASSRWSPPTARRGKSRTASLSPTV